MALSREDVEHVAYLARLSLGPAEVEQMREELSEILDHFRILQDIDTAEVPPTTQAVTLLSVDREDEPRESLPAGDVLSNAPEEEDGFFRVRAVLG